MLYPLLRRAINSTSVKILAPGRLRVREGPLWPSQASFEVQQVQCIKVRGHSEFKQRDRPASLLHTGKTHKTGRTFPVNYSVFAATPTQEAELLYFLHKGFALQFARQIAEALSVDFDENQIEEVAPRDMPFITDERAKRENLGCLLTGSLIVLGLIASAVVLILTHEP